MANKGLAERRGKLSKNPRSYVLLREVVEYMQKLNVARSDLFAEYG